MRDVEARTVVATGAFLVALGIVLGAFGAHVVRGMLDAQRLGWWQTATEFLLWNAIGLVGLSASTAGRALLVVLLIGAGAVIFSGSLYLMALTGERWLGAVTPFGGVAMIGGWLLAGWRALRVG